MTKYERDRCTVMSRFARTDRKGTLQEVPLPNPVTVSAEDLNPGGAIPCVTFAEWARANLSTEGTGPR